MPKPCLLLCLLAACSVSPDDGPDQSCDDPQYGDGVCQTQLACAPPDIDCFTVFPDDAAAAVWFSDKEAKIAQAEGRAPHPTLTAADARFGQARALLDRGWAAFRNARSVGELGELSPSMVLVDDPTPNAFVMSDMMGTKEAFSVHVNTGLLAVSASDDARLAVMMHELQHAIGLHGVGDVKDLIRIHYVAPDGSEPVGRSQLDDATTRTAISSWRDAAEDIGPYTQMQLGPFPFDGQLWTILSAVLGSGVKNTPTQCANANNLITKLRTDILKSVDRLDGRLTIDLAPLPPRINSALAALRNECVPNFPLDFVDVVAAIAKKTRAEIAATMTASDLALVNGRHVVEAVALLASDRRTKMRGFEAMLPGARPWSAARYFSKEEDADDVSVLVLREAGVEPSALAEMMRGLLMTANADAGARCNTLLAGSGIPAYGVDLGDEHHATCWRAYHITQFANAPTESARRRRAVRVETPRIALPMPRNPDLVKMD